MPSLLFLLCVRVLPTSQTNAKGGVAAWPDVPKPGVTLGNLTPADRHGSVQVSPNFQPNSQISYRVASRFCELAAEDQHQHQEAPIASIITSPCFHFTESFSIAVRFSCRFSWTADWRSHYISEHHHIISIHSDSMFVLVQGGEGSETKSRICGSLVLRSTRTE